MRQIMCINCMSKIDIGTEECPHCGYQFTNTNPSGALPVNTLLAGRYTLSKCVSVDGEGIEYEAIDAQTECRVIVKEFIPVTICAARAADGRVIPRTGREVLYKTICMDFIDLYKALLELGPQEGLVSVIDLIEANNTAYAVREPDEGITLVEYLDEIRIPLGAQEALSLLSPIVKGIQAMHQVGLLHRGICPETVRITSQGAKLAGYATLGLRTAGSEFKPHLPEGYAAPEQYSVAEFQGAYTDVYSLGCLFYFAVTGRTPLSANLRKVQDTVPQAHTVIKQIPGYYSAALSVAMRVNAAERPQTAAEFLDSLTVTQQKPSNNWVQLLKEHWQITVACVVGFIILMALSIWAILSTLKPDTNAQSSSSSSVSLSESSSSVPPIAKKTVLVPNFKGQKYEEVARDSEYIKHFLFLPEYEENSEVEKGVIIRQNPLAGAEIEAGSVVRFVISQGTKKALMPRAVGRDVNEVLDDLIQLGIKYRLNTVSNPGNVPKNQVLKSSIEQGQELDLEKDVVQLDVAGEPAPSSSAAPSPAPVPTPPTPPTPPAPSAVQPAPSNTPVAPSSAAPTPPAPAAPSVPESQSLPNQVPAV